MPMDIVAVVVVFAAVAGVLVWKKLPGKSDQGKKPNIATIGGEVGKGEGAAMTPIPDRKSEEEEAAPKIDQATQEMQLKKAELEESAAVENAETQEPAAEPEVKTEEVTEAVPAGGEPESEPEEPAAVENAGPVAVGRKFPDIDYCVEAVVQFNSPVGAFDSAKLDRICKRARECAGIADYIRLEFRDGTNGLWYSDSSLVQSCDQAYLVMLLANRKWVTDEISASNFVELANWIAIELGAEFTPIDSADILQRTGAVTCILNYFDKAINVKIVSMKLIGEGELHEAALACGFNYSEGHYEKREALDSDPLITLALSKQMPNEVEIKLDVVVGTAANQPLAALFSVCNDLCSRIEGVIVDPNGKPITSADAAAAARQLDSLYADMRKHGVSAGSRIAKKIFSSR